MSPDAPGGGTPRAARVLRVLGWIALVIGALFIATAIYLAGVYGGPSVVRDLFTLAHLPDLLSLLSALVPGALLLWLANRLAREHDPDKPPGGRPGPEP